MYKKASVSVVKTGKLREYSEFLQIKESAIHGRGLFAEIDIPRGSKVIEYIGDKITKKESNLRHVRQMKKALKKGVGQVYIFNLNSRFDLDGNVTANIARLINHSCDPNCEAVQQGNRIWLYARRKITAGTELSFNYGFDVEHFNEHPCRCGTENCLGYIVSRKDRKKLINRLEALR